MLFQKLEIIIYFNLYDYTDISRVKGNKGNIAGDGPTNTSIKSRCLTKNGFIIKRHGHRGNFVISNLLLERMHSKFGETNIPLIDAVIHELNNENITNYTATAVSNMVANLDITSIRFVNPGDGVLRLAEEIPRVIQPIRGEYNFERSFIDHTRNFKSLNLLWDVNRPCQYCGCVYFLIGDSVDIRKKCCNGGELFNESTKYPHLNPLPPSLLYFITQRKNHMGRNSVSYNNTLSLGATGIENESKTGGYETIHGDHSVLLHGRTYHFLPNNSRTGGLYFFTYDALQEMNEYGDKMLNSRDKNQEIKHYRFYPEIATALFNELKMINHYVRDCIAIGNQVRDELTMQINLTTTSFEIASIISEEAGRPNRRIIFQLKNEDRPNSIGVHSGRMEPLCYPLFFPYGEFGWSSELRKEIKFSSYMMHRLFLPERDQQGNLILMSTHASPPRQLPFSRFQIMFRLGQIYLVDMISRIIDYRLEFHKYNQQTLFGIDAENSVDVTTGDVNDNNQRDDMLTTGKHTFLSQSFHGSRRHLLSLASNALCLVTEFGRPTLFITLTCNPHWPEIKSMLFEGETAYDRPDITCKVFHTKLDYFLHNLRNGKYFEEKHKVIYEIRVIEYQQRGLPHCHLVVMLSNIPDWKTEKDELCNWIDENINANYPAMHTNSSQRLRQIHELIGSHMVHKCYKGETGCLDEVTGQCTRGFTNHVIQERTTLDEQGYPHYRRNTTNDLNVVSHNVYMLLDWQGHINVEYSGSTYCVIYLYKYLFKGRKKVTAVVKGKKDKQKDEIKAYVQGRYMCAMDAMWRCYGYHTYPSSIPAVNLIKIVLEDTANEFISKNKCQDITVYLNRPLSLRPLLYTQMFQLYRWSYQLTKKYTTRPELLNNIDGFFVIQVTPMTRKIYIMKKVDSSPSITRLATLCILSGEIWYLRQIILYYPILSYKDAKAWNGFVYLTYQEGALARGIIEERGEAKAAFREVIDYYIPSELRAFFVLLTINGYPTMEIYRNEEYCRALMLDYLHEGNSTQGTASEKLIRDLSYRFQQEDKTCTMYGLPEPREQYDELQNQRSKYEPSEQLRLYHELCSTIPSTPEQQDLFNEIIEDIEQVNTSIYFVQGMGGSGKSTLCKKVLAWTRSQGKICLGCASTGLAATIYDDFYTAHSLFHFPVIEDEDRDEDSLLECKLLKHPKRYELLKATSVIVWDEFPSNHREIFEAAYRALNGYKDKVVICFGDFRQIAPVVKYGSRFQVAQASIISSYLWQHFEIRHLTKNMRLLGMSIGADAGMNTDEETYFINQQREYADMIVNIGNGTWKGENCIGEDRFCGSQELLIPNIKCLTNHQEALDFIYPNKFSTPNFHKRAILAGTNKEVDSWNSTIQNMNPNILGKKHLLSADKLAEVDDPTNILKDMLTTEVLNSFNNAGVPPHDLPLCVGDICILQRNLSKKDGLTNNTRVQIIGLRTYSIQVRTLGEHGKAAAIPRIRFKFRLPFGQSFQLRRTQFPLRLAYCMSLNKAQGQEMDTNLLDLRNPVFAHGHLYVGLSRVREASKIAIFTNKDLTFKTSSGSIVAIVKNVVYPELLTPVGIIHSADTSFDSANLNEESSDITSTYDSTQDQGIESWEALLAEMRFLTSSLTMQHNENSVLYTAANENLEPQFLGHDETKG